MKKRPLFSRVFSNFFYKLLALAIAVVVWYVVQSEEILEINKRLDISIDVPQGLAVRDGTTISRDVTLRGPRVALSEFSSRPLQAVIRVPSGKRGNLRYRIDKEYIPQWDNRIRLTIHDPYVTIFVDERASRAVPVRVSMQGIPKAGLSVHNIKAEPPEITVTGIKSDVQKITEVSTEVVDLSGLTEAKSLPVPLVTTSLQDFELSAKQVVVHVTLGQAQSERVFEMIPIDIVGTERLSIAKPQTVAVTLEGGADFLSTVATRDIQAYADAKSLSPGRFERPVEVKVPLGTSVRKIVPSSVTIEIYNQRKLK